jgi:hypothetical protein
MFEHHARAEKQRGRDGQNRRSIVFLIFCLQQADFFLSASKDEKLVRPQGHKDVSVRLSPS